MWPLKVALQILVPKFYKNTKNSSLYSLLNTIQQQEKFEIYYMVDIDGKHGLFFHEQLAHLHTRIKQTKLQT